MSHVFKCKMCGGVLEVQPGMTICECEYCGAIQTLPRLDSDRKANLYDRASHFRRNNDFDKAMGIYELILNEDTTDAEAYWSLVLCKYGIEYVEDPRTHKRIPTVNRTQFTSIFADDDYKSALKYADEDQKKIYETEAQAIDRIQKGILDISNKEEPFDIFICYKETDETGKRTPDSVLGYELYRALTNEGYKVFFSRVTLEDKLGVAYEPYIFAALNSAKVMIVIGTKREYFDAVWVKNEWGRYLALVKQSNGKKYLIPAYKDMDPYDLPEEFSHLQAQDLGKLGYLQDMVRGIHKLLGDDKPKVASPASQPRSETEPLLKRAFLFLGDGNYAEADRYCERVLDMDPENAQAYLGKLLAGLNIRKASDLAHCENTFADDANYQKAVRYGNQKLKDELLGLEKKQREYLEERRLQELYDNAVNLMNESATEQAFKEAGDAFKAVSGYKDSDSMAEKCLNLAEESRKDAIYDAAKALMNGNDVASYNKAIAQLETIPEWKDAGELIADSRKRIELLQAEKLAREEANNKKKKTAGLFLACAVALAAALFVAVNFIIPGVKYNSAVKKMNSGEYTSAYTTFENLGDYKDSRELMQACREGKNNEALAFADAGEIVTFGLYEQDNNTATGNEEIEWIVLAREGDKVLIISRYGLDCQKFNYTRGAVTWETCSLRNWLNNEFILAAFSSSENLMIDSTHVTAENNPRHKTEAGNDTDDMLFLLSINEANQYFSSDAERTCKPTEYAKSAGAITDDAGNCWWRLRSPGISTDHAASVYPTGSIDEEGTETIRMNHTIRPAMWIDISKIGN